MKNETKIKAVKVVSDVLEDIIGDVMNLTGSNIKWGEVEMPDCVRKTLEEESAFVFNFKQEKIFMH